MTPAAVRFLLVTGLFLGWVGYLLVLVLTKPDAANGLPVIVSRPQVLTSEVVVVGTLDDARQRVTVLEVLGPEAEGNPKAGDVLPVANLDRCEPRLPGGDLGACLLPLGRSEDRQTYYVTPLPPSPGYAPHPPRVYAATPDTKSQALDVLKK